MPSTDIFARHRMRQRTSPWIGVGTSGQWNSVDRALEDCDLDFTVSPNETFTEVTTTSAFCGITPQPVKLSVPGIVANVREDTNEIVGVVSDRYGIVQNYDAFHLLDPFVNAGAVIEHGGMTAQGMCFMVAKMTTGSIQGDKFEFWICAMNSFNSKYPLALFVTPVRVVCQNMFRGIMSRSDGLLHIKHGGNSGNRLETAGNSIRMAENFLFHFNDFVNVGANKKLDPEQAIEWLFPNADKSNPNWKLSQDRVMDMREMFFQEYYMAADNRPFVDTAYGFINAYFDYLSHRPEPRGNTASWEHRRFTGLLSGKDVDRSLLAKAMT